MLLFFYFFSNIFAQTIIWRLVFYLFFFFLFRCLNFACFGRFSCLFASPYGALWCCVWLIYIHESTWEIQIPVRSHWMPFVCDHFVCVCVKCFYKITNHCNVFGVIKNKILYFSNDTKKERLEKTIFVFVYISMDWRIEIKIRNGKKKNKSKKFIDIQ